LEQITLALKENYGDHNAFVVASNELRVVKNRKGLAPLPAKLWHFHTSKVFHHHPQQQPKQKNFWNAATTAEVV
jgi:hypothetical protein